MDQDSKQRPRYCATGDEKYYLDLPGKENEKVVNKLLMRYHFLCSSSIPNPSIPFLPQHHYSRLYPYSYSILSHAVITFSGADE